MSDCKACGLPAEGFGLPVNEFGEIVDNEYRGEWAGMPACRGCFTVHRDGGAKGLAAHVAVTSTLRHELTDRAILLRKIARQADVAAGPYA